MQTATIGSKPHWFWQGGGQPGGPEFLGSVDGNAVYGPSKPNPGGGAIGLPWMPPTGGGGITPQPNPITPPPVQTAGPGMGSTKGISIPNPFGTGGGSGTGVNQLPTHDTIAPDPRGQGDPTNITPDPIAPPPGTPPAPPPLNTKGGAGGLLGGPNAIHPHGALWSRWQQLQMNQSGPAHGNYQMPDQMPTGAGGQQKGTLGQQQRGN